MFVFFIFVLLIIDLLFVVMFDGKLFFYDLMFVLGVEMVGFVGCNGLGKLMLFVILVGECVFEVGIVVCVVLVVMLC